MNCNEFQNQLAAAIEKHGPTANERIALSVHLQSCDSADCARAWSDYELLSGALEHWREDVPQVDMKARVVLALRQPATGAGPHPTSQQLQANYALVREPAPSVRPRPRHSWTTFAATAAALLLLASVMTLSRPASEQLASRDKPESHIPPAVIAENDGTDAARVLPETADDPPAGTEQPAHRFGSIYASIPLSASEFVTDAVVFVVPADLTDPDEEPTRADVWAARVGDRLEPIGRELGTAFESLLEAVPKSSPRLL